MIENNVIYKAVKQEMPFSPKITVYKLALAMQIP
jgi:hypothetical protein